MFQSLCKTHQCTVDELARNVMAEGAWPGVAHCSGGACSGLIKGFTSYIVPWVLQQTIRVELTRTR